MGNDASVTSRRSECLCAAVLVAALLSACRNAADSGNNPAEPPPRPKAAAPGAAPGPSETPPAQAPQPAPQPSTAPDPLLTAQQALPVSEQQDVPVPGDLRLAMEEFAESLREQDVSRALAKFSRAGGLRYVDTRRAKLAPQSLDYTRIERELKAQTGVYLALFGATGVRTYVSGNYALPWLGIATDEFAPRGADAKKIWIRWRAEGDAWFVDTLALPAALPRALQAGHARSSE